MQTVNIYPLLNTNRIYEQEISMALTHLVEKYPGYAECFRKYHGYKILDNSLIEVGSAMSLKRVLYAACLIDADEIILPDVFKDGPGTIKSVQESLEFLATHAYKERKLMAVCQGATRQEFIDCFYELNRMKEIDVIGIPKVTSIQFDTGRKGLEYLWTLSDCKKEIHLLGLHNSFSELTQYKDTSKIRSCDTCLASLLAYENVSSNTPRQLLSYPKRNLEEFYVTEEQYIKYMLRSGGKL